MVGGGGEFDLCEMEGRTSLGGRGRRGGGGKESRSLEHVHGVVWTGCHVRLGQGLVLVEMEGEERVVWFISCCD
jgi:hypothetical protein